MQQNKKTREALTKLIERIEAAENHRDKRYRDRWAAYYKMWRNIVDELKDNKGKPIKDRSNISVPYVFTMMETVLPRLVESIFAARPYVRVKGVPISRQQYKQVMDQFAQQQGQQEQAVMPWTAAAEKMETLLDYQMNVPFDIQDIFHTGLKIMALYGTTVAYTGWKYKERTVIRKQLEPVLGEDEKPITEANGTPVTDWQPVEVNEKEYDDPEVKFLDIGLFFVDPDAEDIDGARFAGHQEFMTKEEIDAEAERDGDKIDWKKVPKEAKKNEAREYRDSVIGIPLVDNDVFEHSDTDRLYEVIRYWEDDRCVKIINRGYLWKDEENPFWHKKKPYDKDVYTKDPGQFYGIGLVEVMYDQQFELNAERNQRIDYRSYSLRRMFKVRRGADINRNQLQVRQGGVVEVDEMDDLDTLDMPPISGDSFNQEMQIKQDMRDATGAQDVVMGAMQNADTATGTMTRDNNAAMRFKLIISSVEKRLLVAVSRKMIQLNQQLIDDIRLLPVFEQDDAEWPEIAPEDIQGEFHLTAAGSSVEPMANKEAYKQRMVELYGIAASDPFYQMYPEKRRNLLKMVFESFDIQNTDDLLPSDDELAGEIEKAAIQKFFSQLPPQVAAQVAMALQSTGGGAPTSTAPPMMPTGSRGGGLDPVGGGMNTAQMEEPALAMATGGGGGLL